jgi:hypothetical protein
MSASTQPYPRSLLEETIDALFPSKRQAPKLEDTRISTRQPVVELPPEPAQQHRVVSWMSLLAEQGEDSESKPIIITAKEIALLTDKGVKIHDPHEALEFNWTQCRYQMRKAVREFE